MTVVYSKFDPNILNLIPWQDVSTLISYLHGGCIHWSPSRTIFALRHPLGICCILCLGYFPNPSSPNSPDFLLFLLCLLLFCHLFGFVLMFPCICLKEPQTSLIVELITLKRTNVKNLMEDGILSMSLLWCKKKVWNPVSWIAKENENLRSELRMVRSSTSTCSRLLPGTSL